MIIKATRLQALGGGRVGRRPPPLKLKSFLAILRAFLLLFLQMEAFFLRFLIFGGLFTMWGPFCYFHFMVGAFFWACPPPLRELLRAPMIAMQGGFESILPGNFLCDRNLRFCLKNVKYTDKL